MSANPMNLDGKVAIVTGGAQGIGAATVALLAQLGARVVSTDIEPDKSNTGSFDGRVTFIKHDVSKQDQWLHVIERAEALYGPVNILVNNAGIVGKASSVQETEEDNFKRVQDVNQTGVFLGMQTIAPSMKRAGGGSIVNVSSVVGLVGVPNNFAYSTSKFAVTGMTKAAALDLGAFGIRVNSVHPGTISTRLTQDDPAIAAVVVTALKALPIPRMGAPLEIANVIAFLASDAASFCTGAAFVADGGWSTS